MFCFRNEERPELKKHTITIVLCGYENSRKTLLILKRLIACAPWFAPGARQDTWAPPIDGEPSTGLVTLALVAAIVDFSVTMFRGGFADSVPVIVLSPRAGLVMTVDAKVKMRGVQVGRVSAGRMPARTIT